MDGENDELDPFCFLDVVAAGQELISFRSRGSKDLLVACESFHKHNFRRVQRRSRV